MRELCKKIFIPFGLFAAMVSMLSAESIVDAGQKNTNLFPGKIIAGSLDIRTPGSAARVNMQQAKEDGYNVMAVTYGEVYGTEISFTSSGSEISKQTAIDKIINAKKAGVKILLVVGGIPNTFHPGIKQGQLDPKILGKGMSSAEINILATNIVSFLKKYGMSGIVYAIKKYTSSKFINDLSMKIKAIDSNLIVAAGPEVNDYHLVTTGKSNDYDLAIQSGNIDYLFIQEYNAFMEADPDFISNSYSKLIENSKIPLQTKIVIVEPTNAVSGGTNTLYHPEGNATESLTTKEAVALMLPQLEKLKFKPRFAGMGGWSLNTDYAADLYGDPKHRPGAFAKELKSCIYNNICAPTDKKIQGPVIAGFLTLWGKNGSYNISGQQVNTEPVNISMPKDKEYCDQDPEVCKYNVIIAAYLTYVSSKGFTLSFNDENGSSKKIYTPAELKIFIDYMKSKGKHVLVSVGGKFSHIDWRTVNLNDMVQIVQSYGFDGVNFDLTDSDIPKDKDVSRIAAKKIINAITKLKQKDHSFWLTFSPEWHYIVAPVAKSSNDNIYANHHYIDLLQDIGIDNINYIWLDTYAERPADAIIGFDKNEAGQYQRVSPIDSYPKFLASLAWALTTQKGYETNLPKYKSDIPFNIPANKLVFVIPATKGTVHGGMTYVLSKQDINDTVALINKNKASFAGFAVWTIDFDSTKINDGDLSKGYSHEPWVITNAISEIELPSVVSQVVTKGSKSVNTKVSKEQGRTIDTGIISYPDKIGTYKSDTIISYQGKKYKCLSALELKLCNDKSYIPNGLHGYLAWEELGDYDAVKKSLSEKQEFASDGKTLKYPSGIGSYVAEQIVAAGDRRFECQEGKRDACNNIKYDPIGPEGYKAWNDVTGDIAHLREKSKQVKPKGAEYIYPNGIESYSGGTVVAVGSELYRCKVGPESSLCLMEVYSPTGKYGSDAWLKLGNE